MHEEYRRRIADLETRAHHIGNASLEASAYEKYAPELQRLAAARETEWNNWHGRIGDLAQAAAGVETALREIDNAETADDIGAARATANLRMGHCENVALLAQRRGVALQRAHSEYVAAAARIAKNPAPGIREAYFADQEPRLAKAQKQYDRALTAMRTAVSEAQAALAAVEAACTHTPATAQQVRILARQLPDLAGMGTGAHVLSPGVVLTVAEGRARYRADYGAVEWFDERGLQQSVHVSNFTPDALPAC